MDDLKIQTLDMIFMDIHIKKMDGAEITRQVLAHYPAIKIIAVTASDDGVSVKRMLEAGASAYITKDVSAKELEHVFDHIYQGKIYITPTAAKNYHRYVSFQPVKPLTEADIIIQKDDLSERALKIIQLVAEGKKGWEIADILHLSDKTIEADKKKITAQFGVKKFTEVIVQAYKFELLP